MNNYAISELKGIYSITLVILFYMKNYIVNTLANFFSCRLFDREHIFLAIPAEYFLAVVIADSNINDAEPEFLFKFLGCQLKALLFV